MSYLEFEWDEEKNKANIRKHGVSFKEACSTFYDEEAIRYFDPENSEDEDRFLLLGLSADFKTLVVSHCFRKQDSYIRIISARKADKSEQKVYWSRSL